MAPCCGSYKILEDEYLIFQKEVCDLSLRENHSFDKASFTVRGKEGYLKLGMEVYDTLSRLQMVDTTLVIYVP